MADKIKIGHDKLPAPIIPTNVPLYNEQTSSILTDEGNIPIVSEEDIVLSSRNIAKASTSVVFTDEIKSTEIKTKRITGVDFQALNNAIFTLTLTKSGSNFNTRETPSEFLVPLDPDGGVVRAKIRFTSNRPGQVSGINSFEVIEGGGGYTEGFTFTIPSDLGGEDAEFRVDSVQTEVSARNGNFTKDLTPNSLISLPTGIDDEGNNVYERRRVRIIKNDNSLFFPQPISLNKPRTSTGVGFGKLEKIEIRELNSTIPVEEQFAAFSEVSTTILGYPKAETQLGLFSNVSSYGLDNDEFLFYRSGTERNEPIEWTQRRSLYYGPHLSRERLKESTEESALVLESFSTPYTFPFGPNVNNFQWSTTQHERYNRFVKIGCLLYDWYKPGGGGYPGDNGDYARNFLPYVKNHVAIDGSGIILYDSGSGPGDLLASIQPDAFFPFGDRSGVNIKYFKDNEEIYLFEQWNQTDNTFTGDPVGTIKFLNFDFTLHFNEEIGDLLENYRVLNGNIDMVLVGKESLTRAPVVSDMNWFNNLPSAPYNNVSRSDQNFWTNILNPLNPYYTTQQDLFNQIDTWTETWRKIRSGEWNLPGSLGKFDVQDDLLFNPLIIRYLYNDAENIGNGYSGNAFIESLPGHSSAIRTDCTLLSRKAFRYQPGRISGFTFGVRASGDASTNDVRIEWGIGNDTDELVFQIQGANLNIVRRSTVPLSDSVMRRNNLDPGNPLLEDQRNRALSIAADTSLSVSERITQLESIFGTPITGAKQYPIILQTQNQEDFTGLGDKIAFETKIQNSLWNGDPLNGNGPSGWDADVEDVTMYKIEFGWYGAIGVRFYAYVPIDNNEARWVALHTLVIENQLGVPSMGDPYFKFLYRLVIEDHNNVSTPQYVYKYGTSCYIDGGDQGTVKVGSAFSGVKSAPSELGGVNRSTTIVGLIPKTVIYNTLGKAIKNKQSIFPRELSLSADSLTEVALVKCTSCPGYAHAYMPNLRSGYKGDERYFRHPIVPGGVDRANLELPQLTRVATGSQGSNQVVLANSPNDIAGAQATTPIKFIRVGDVFDPDNLTGAFTGESFEYAYIVDINSNTNTITLDKNLGSNISGDVQIQPIFTEKKDLFAKIISPGVFLTYIGPYDGTSGYTENISPWDTLGFDFQNTYESVFPSLFGDRVAVQVGLATTEGFPIDQVQPSEYYFNGNDPNINPYRKLEDRKRSGFGFVFAPVEFPGRLSAYKAVAGSTVALYGKENDLLWLAPGNYGSPDQGSYNDDQFADYKVGITNLKPIINPTTKELLQWESPLNPGVPVEFTDDYKISAERYNVNIVRSIDRFELGEDNSNRVPPFTVDYRIPPPPGTNSGRCQYVKIKIDDPIVKNYYQWRGSALRSEFSNESNSLQEWFEKNGEVWDDDGYYLVFQSSTRPVNYNAIGSEIAFNPNLGLSDDPFDPKNLPSSGTGIVFSTDWITLDFPQGQGAGNVKYNVARIKSIDGSDVPVDPTAADGDLIITYTTQVTLVSFRKLAQGSFNYNPFPLYFFIELRDGVTINGPQIREVGQVENNYNPLFGVSDQMEYTNANIRVGTIGDIDNAIAAGNPGLVTTTGNLDDSPPNFTSTERLSSALIDTQGTAQLRPFELVDKLYVSNESKQIDLRPIFDFQKETITPDLLNTTAYFFIATCKEPGATSSQVSGTLNYLEQQ